MKDAPPIPLLIPLVVGFAAVICTVLIHVLPLSATVGFVRREKKLGHLGTSFRCSSTAVSVER
jgi:hypothetical protein